MNDPESIEDKIDIITRITAGASNMDGDWKVTEISYGGITIKLEKDEN